MALEIEEVHVRRCRVVIRKADLEHLVREYAIKAAGFAGFATTAKITFDDVTEGSPGYKVGSQCFVDLAEDQKKLPVAEEK